jgi:hypothetical protein
MLTLTRLICITCAVLGISPSRPFYVCRASGGCTASSLASDWINLDDMPYGAPAFALGVIALCSAFCTGDIRRRALCR